VCVLTWLKIVLSVPLLASSMRNQPANVNAAGWKRRWGGGRKIEKKKKKGRKKGRKREKEKREKEEREMRKKRILEVTNGRIICR
jgi:hypothetical protein